MANLGCSDNSTACDYETRLKLGKFLGCFEGGHIEEGHCPQDPKNCSDFAGLDGHYDEIMACFNNDTQVSTAADKLAAECTAQNITGWPHVLVNGEQAGGRGCNTDSCVIPILPVLCKAYIGTPKPKSCELLEAGEIFAQ